MKPAKRGEEILRLYVERFEFEGGPWEFGDEDAYAFLGDLVADLHHYAAQRGLPPTFIDAAYGHYLAEREAAG